MDDEVRKKNLKCQAKENTLGNRESFCTFKFGNAGSELNFRHFNGNIKNSIEALQCPYKK